MCLLPHFVCENAFYGVKMVLKSSLWCLDDPREPQQHFSLIAHAIWNEEKKFAEQKSPDHQSKMSRASV